MASIYQKSSTAFVVRFELPRVEGGQRRRAAKTFKTRDEAERFRCWAEPARHRGVVEDLIQPAMESWISFQAEIGRLNAKTAERQMNLAQNWGLVLPKKKLCHLTAEDVKVGVARLKTGGGASGRPLARLSLRQHVTVARRFFRHLTKTSLLMTSPFEAIDEPPIPSGGVAAASQEQIEALLALAARATYGSGQLTTLIETLSGTGLRRGEALALT